MYTAQELAVKLQEALYRNDTAKVYALVEEALHDEETTQTESPATTDTVPTELPS